MLIVYPTWYSGQHYDNSEVADREGMALDPMKYFIIVPNTPGNGSSIPQQQPGTVRSRTLPYA